jgi:hypothetical protein
VVLAFEIIWGFSNYFVVLFGSIQIMSLWCFVMVLVLISFLVSVCMIEKLYLPKVIFDLSLVLVFHDLLSTISYLTGCGASEKMHI